jgi:hypothetical protein
MADHQAFSVASEATERIILTRNGSRVMGPA